MPTVPRVQTPDVISAPQNQRRLSMSLASNEAAGAAALARGLADVGGVAEEFAIRSARAKNQTDLVRAKLAMDKASADIQADLESDADVRNWEPKAQKRIDEASNAILSSDLAPETRRALEAEVAAWSQKTAATVSNQRMRTQNRENDAVLQEAMIQAYTSGKIDEGDAYADMRVELGLQSQQVMHVAKNRGHKTADVQTANRQMNEDPLGALDALKDKTEGGEYRNFTHLDPNERLALQREAEVRVSRLRAETQQGFAERIYAGEFVSQEELDGAVEDRLVTATQAKWLMKQQGATAADPVIPQTAAVISQRISRIDPGQPDAQNEYWQVFGQVETLPPAYRDQLRRELRSVMNPTPASGRASVSNEFFRAQWSAGAYGETVKESGAFVDSEAAGRASRTMLALQDEMDAWLEKNPTASRLEVRQKAEELDAATRAAPLIAQVTKGTVIKLKSDGSRWRFTGADPNDFPASYQRVTE